MKRMIKVKKNQTKCRVGEYPKGLELDFHYWNDNLLISKRSLLAKALKLKPGDILEVSFKKIKGRK